MILKTLLKYKILDYCLDVFFNTVENNFKQYDTSLTENEMLDIIELGNRIQSLDPKKKQAYMKLLMEVNNIPYHEAQDYL